MRIIRSHKHLIEHEPEPSDFCTLIAIVGTLLILAIACTARADNIADLRTAIDDGLPVSACWNVVGFKFDWHVEQVKQGRRLYPSIACPYVYGGDNANSAKALKYNITPFPSQFAYLRENKLPIMLRYNNVAQTFAMRPRLDPLPENIPLSPLAWNIDEDGSLNDLPSIDVFGPPEIWKEEGGNLAQSTYLKTLQELLPDPAVVFFAENNEGSDIKFKSALRTLPKQKGDTEIRYGWLSLDELSRISLRYRDRVAQLDPKASPWDEYPSYSARRSALYSAFHDGLKAGLSPAWVSRFRTAAYSAGDGTVLPPSVAAKYPALQADPFDAYGPPFYVGWFQTYDLTDPSNLAEATKGIPGWLQHEERRPGSLREVFLFMSDGGALFGASAGKYEVITPARWQALCEWLLWTCHKDGGGPVLLHYWNGAATKPTDPFFPGSSDERLVGITHGDYVKATALACDRVCEAPELREFWLKGTKVPVTYPPGPVNVWRSVIKHPDGRLLLYCWTPCLFGGAVTVPVDGLGDVSIDFGGAPSAYRVYAPPDGGWQWRGLKN